MTDETIVLKGRPVVDGYIEAEAIVTDETISGWGGVDPADGTIIEMRHELHGESFTDKVLVFRGAKGSSGWSSIFHTTRLADTAPAAMVYEETTTKVALGAVVTRVPAVTDLDEDPTEVIDSGDLVAVDGDEGIVTITKRADSGDRDVSE
ncbi:aconitase X swivel domain-containing protein [Halostagnicola bangensis]